MPILKNQPRLRQITLLRDRVAEWGSYPFSVPVVRNLTEISFGSRVCFFVGENGSGKSTLLEAIAEHVGFNREGGGRNFLRETTNSVRSTSPLSRALRLSWSKKLTQGFFLRAESFFNMATYLDELQKETRRPWHRMAENLSTNNRTASLSWRFLKIVFQDRVSICWMSRKRRFPPNGS